MASATSRRGCTNPTRTERALADLERLNDFLIEVDPKAALETMGLIEEAQAAVLILAIRHQREAGDWGEEED